LAELSSGGAIVRSLNFPDAFGPDVMAVGADGSIFLAGQERTATKFGDLTLPDVEDGFYLLKLSPTFEVVAATMVASSTTQVNALQVDAQGDLIVGTAVSNFQQGKMYPVVAKYSGTTLKRQWSTPFTHEAAPALIYGLSVLSDGRIAAAGLYSRSLTIGSFVLQKPAGAQADDFIYNGWVAWLSATAGEPLAAQTFGGSVSDSALDLHATASGGLRVLSAHSGGLLTLFGTDVDLGEDRTALSELDSSGKALRVAHFGTVLESSSKMVDGLHGETYVAGRYGDPQGDVSQRGAQLTRVEPDGTLGPKLELSTGHGVTQLAVDAAGGVWMTGGWETAFEWKGQTYRPEGVVGEPAGCRLLLRLEEF
jgi:hypothetical protein